MRIPFFVRPAPESDHIEGSFSFAGTLATEERQSGEVTRVSGWYADGVVLTTRQTDRWPDHIKKCTIAQRGMQHCRVLGGEETQCGTKRVISDDSCVQYNSFCVLVWNVRFNNDRLLIFCKINWIKHN